MWRGPVSTGFYREYDEAVLPHKPSTRDVSGRPQVLLMLERIAEYIRSHDGVRFVTMEEIADDFPGQAPAGETVNQAGHDSRFWRPSCLNRQSVRPPLQYLSPTPVPSPAWCGRFSSWAMSTISPA